MKLLSFQICILYFCLLTTALTGQKTGKITYDQLGIEFTIPDGWVGQEGNGAFIMGSNSIPGIILLLPQSYTDIAAMKKDLMAGYADEAGTNLTAEGNSETLTDNTLGVIYTGVVEGQPAKGYAIGAFNHLGNEVAILALTTVSQFGDQHISLAKSVAKSLRFFAPKTAPIIEEWNQLLRGTKLTYLDSYYSPSYTEGGISGGYSTKIVFDLCPEGYFIHYGNDLMSAGGESSNAFSSSKSEGSGTWKVIVNASGQPTLQFTFNNNEVWEYTLEMREKSLYMNGNKYYRTWTGENAPSCQ